MRSRAAVPWGGEGGWGGAAGHQLGTGGDSPATVALQSPHCTSKESSELDHRLQAEFAETEEKQITTEEVGRLEWQAQAPGESLPGSRMEQRSCP